jgi:uncharacterized membrane protein YjgN (DUF898 family)
MPTHPTKSAVPLQLPFRFTGDANEYFRIWIVNVALSVATLGIYSAWAKVRTKRYFYGNTWLDNDSFCYLADPLKILKGRLITVGALLLFWLSAELLPFVNAMLILIAFPLLLPWVIIKALSFDRFNTSFRNIRFHFSARYGQALTVFIGWPVLSALTLGLLYPYTVFRKKQFLVEHTGYGQSSFTFAGSPGAFYVTYLVAWAIGLGIAVAGGIIIAILVATVVAASPAPPEQWQNLGPPFGVEALVTGATFLYLLAFMALRIYVQTEISNQVWRNTLVGENRFHSRLRILPMLWLYLSNLVAIVFSLGLLIPWARVRMARYRVQQMSLAAPSSLENFMAAAQRRVSATGDEVGEVLGLDFAL